MVLKFHMQHYHTAGLQNIKTQPGQESEMATITKKSETNKIIFFLQNHSVYLAEISYDTLLGPWFLELFK